MKNDSIGVISSPIKPLISAHDSEDRDKKSLFYNDVLDGWLASVRLQVKESTYARYRGLLQTHIRPTLGGYAVERLSAEAIRLAAESWLAHGRADGRGGLSVKTVSDMLALIKNSIVYAQDKGLCMGCRLHRLTLKKKDREMRVLSQGEQETLVRFLLRYMDLYRFGTLLALYTGLRVGELCALQWKDIQRSPPMLSVRKTLQRIPEEDSGAKAKTKIILTEPKSRCSRRDIPLPAFLSALAEKFRGTPDSYVLSGTEGRYVEPRVMQYHFHGYLAQCGIAPANFHALRHTFATRCVELGFEIKTLSEILGHSNVNMTLNLYVHSSFALKQKNMSRLSLPEDCPATDYFL